MNRDWKRLLWSGGKLVLAALILFFIGRQLLSDMYKLDFKTITLRPEWLAAASALYLVSLLPSMFYWRHLHAKFGYPLPLYAALRANYIAQLGKYVPGKALSLLMRAHFTHPFGVPYGVSIIISFYDVLTAMAAGGIVAALVYAVELPGELDIGLHPAAIGVVLMGMCGIPLLPSVFNFVVARLSANIQAVQLYRLPPVRFGVLASGLLMTGVGWWIQGLSWWAMLYAVLPDPPAATFSMWAQCTASIAFATVAGFVIIFIPGGFGVRELLLRQLLLGFVGPAEYISAAAILLRLDWIATEVLFALCTYWLPPPRREIDN